jgi:hypothetical protein
VLAEFGWHLSTEEIEEKFVGKSSATFTAHLDERLGYALPSNWEDKVTLGGPDGCLAREVRRHRRQQVRGARCPRCPRCPRCRDDVNRCRHMQSSVARSK